MNNEINFFDFWKLIWLNKLYIISLALFLSLVGLAYSYYINLLPQHYRGTLIIYPLATSELIAIERIKIASENSIYKKNGCSGLGCNFRDDVQIRKDYLIDFSNQANLSAQLLEEFYIKFMSKERRKKSMKVVNYLENTKLQVSEFPRRDILIDFNDNFSHNFLTDNLRVNKISNEKIIIMLTHSDYEKLYEFLDHMATSIIKDINLGYQKIIFDTISNLKQDKITQEKALQRQVKKLENWAYPKKDIIRYGISQKITFLRIDFLIERIKNAYEFSELKDMAFMPVQYDSSEISVEKLNRYRVNYPILGFFGGIFLSVLIIIVRK